MSRILIVEDSEICQVIVAKALADTDRELCPVSTFREAQEALTTETFDLVILDIKLPDGDSLNLFNSFKEKLMEVPTLVISGISDLDSKLKAFGLGASDYITKPVNPRELRARVDMQLRKSSRRKGTVSLLRKGPLTINIPLLRASLDTSKSVRELDLTGKEFKILCFLVQNEGKSFSRQQLVQAVWGESVHVLDRTVDSHVCGLRRKLGPAAPFVESVPNIGYRFTLAEDFAAVRSS